MDNDEMRELAPALRGKVSAEFGFDLDRIVAVDDSQQIGDAFDVRIDRESRPRTTFAVLRPTPGREVSSSIVCGTSPLKSDAILRQAPMMFAPFAR